MGGRPMSSAVSANIVCIIQLLWAFIFNQVPQGVIRAERSLRDTYVVIIIGGGAKFRVTPVKSKCKL